MKYNPEIHHRHSIRLQEYDYSQPGGYFITIVSHNREHLFGKIIDKKMILSNYGKIVEKYWNEIPHHYPNITLDAFVIMPNHIHGIIIINETFVGAIHELPRQKENELPRQNNDESSKQLHRKMLLPKIIGYFKMNSAKQINIIRQKSGNPVWQRNYYEHIIRNNDELNRIRNYIINNPLNWKNDKNYFLA